jgi:hypothetical protein
MDEARAATKIFREVPLADNMAPGRGQGKADLLFEARAAWRMAEFKTDAIDDAFALQEHAVQMAACARSLAHLVGVQPKVTICFVRPVQVLEF